jgi:hypothetical protein
MTPPITAEPLLVPGEVTVAGDDLRWVHSSAKPARRIQSPNNLLEQFVELRAGSDAEIAAFASKYGVLGICEHNIPRSHNVGRIRLNDAVNVEDDDPSLGCPGVCDFSARQKAWVGRDPLRAYRDWAQLAMDVQSLAAAAHHETTVDRKAWDRVVGRPYSSRRHVRREVSRQVQRWLEIGGVQPQFTWDNDSGVVITLGTRSTWEPLPKDPAALWSWGHAHGTTLFPALAIQLAMSVSQADGFAFCSSCGLSYVPDRRPAAGRRRYCARCQETGAPIRDAQRAYRERRAERTR